MIRYLAAQLRALADRLDPPLPDERATEIIFMPDFKFPSQIDDELLEDAAEKIKEFASQRPAPPSRYGREIENALARRRASDDPPHLPPEWSEVKAIVNDYSITGRTFCPCCGQDCVVHGERHNMRACTACGSRWMVAS